MTQDDLKILRRDTDGLLSYEFLANHIGDCDTETLEAVIDNMERVDLTGQFMASAARYLHAIDAEGFAPAVRRLVAATIDKDREHAYLPLLLQSLYGDDYHDNAQALCSTDDNFRRIYKRLFPTSVI